MSTENKPLTNEEIAKVFAMYFGQNIVTSNNGGNGSPIHNALALYTTGMLKIKTCKLLLMPLSEMTNDNVKQVIKMERRYGLKCLDDILQNVYRLTYPTYIFLQSMGYDTPIYFSPNHLGNGKTAIELGIAIDKNKINENGK